MPNPTNDIVLRSNPTTLVVQTVARGRTTVDVVSSPLSAVTRVAADQTLLVGTPGPQGPPGPAGSGGGGAGNVFIQNAAPSSPPATYAWFQTLLGNSGHDITLWVQDGP